jgi:chromosome segregation ATPase
MTRIETLESDLNIADQDRTDLRTRLSNLNRDLQTARQSSSTNALSSKERQGLVELARKAKLEAEDLSARAGELEKERNEIDRNFQSQLRDLEDRLRKSRSRVAELETHPRLDNRVVELQDQILEKDKRHVKEIQGLAKQIQYLRARCVREEGFRDSLGYQKRFCLMMIEVYNQW